MSEALSVHSRDLTGKRNARRLRAGGQVPAILYGHGKPNVALAIPEDDLLAILRHHTRVVELEGAAQGTALLRDVQFDPLGIDVLHVDLTRVSSDETVEVEIGIHLRGDAPGSHHGGMLEHVTHEVTVLCPVASIPEQLELSISQLEVEQSLSAADLVLPRGAKLVTPADTVIVTCHVVPGAVEEVSAEAATEPEVIGRKEQAEEEAD